MVEIAWFFILVIGLFLSSLFYIPTRLIHPVSTKPTHQTSRQRFRELRQCMQNDDDENPGNTLTPDSQVDIYMILMQFDRVLFI